MNIDGMNMEMTGMTGCGQIYQLIGKAIGMIGAIGKDKKNPQQGFMYRGIDQVYNALNPVLAELGIFFVPDVLDMKREERVTKNGTVLTYTILTMKYTAFAPDGSYVCMTVVGEGMDSGDKGCNKAMSVAMKYAMFQLFCIPTEEMKDPDAEVHKDILPSDRKQAQVQQKPAENGSVTMARTIPQAKEESAEKAVKQPETAGAYMKRRIAEMAKEYAGIGFDFAGIRQKLIEAGQVPNVPSATMTMEQAEQLIREVEFFYEEKKAAS